MTGLLIEMEGPPQVRSHQLVEGPMSLLWGPGNLETE